MDFRTALSFHDKEDGGWGGKQTSGDEFRRESSREAHDGAAELWTTIATIMSLIAIKITIGFSAYNTPQAQKMN